MTSKPIFVSHAAADARIARAVVDLLQSGMSIDIVRDVFCSSLEETGIPAGSDFKHFIKAQIQEPQIVVMLLSRNYLASTFCLAEVGASWAMSHRAIPILVPPVEFGDLKAVLSNTQALRVDRKEDWNTALEVFATVPRGEHNTNRWERKRDEFLEIVGRLINEQVLPSTVSQVDHQKVVRQLEDANKEIQVCEQKLKALAQVHAKVKSLKDAREVRKIEVESMDELARLKQLCGAAAKLLVELPIVVRKALYRHFRGETIAPPDELDDESWKEIRNAVDKNFLIDRGSGEIELSLDEPKVARAVEALDELRSFAGKASSRFVAAYAEQFDHKLNFTSIQFWAQWLPVPDHYY